jgi:hypothetical protein
MMALTINWIYAARLTAGPEHLHKVKVRTSFIFSPRPDSMGILIAFPQNPAIPRKIRWRLNDILETSDVETIHVFYSWRS